MKKQRKLGKTGRKAAQKLNGSRRYSTKKYDWGESRGGGGPSKCEEHKEHRNSISTVFWPRSKGTYIRAAK